MFINLHNSLGFREMQRLTSFIDLMMSAYPQDCCDSTFGYSMHYDSPYIIVDTEGLTSYQLYAEDYDIAFNEHNLAEFI